MDEWADKVMKAEGLGDWTLTWSTTGGLTRRGEIICNSNDPALFLHEVAHALTYPDDTAKDVRGHGTTFADTLTDLVRKYMAWKP